MYDTDARDSTMGGGGDTFPDLRGRESGMCPSINVNQPLNNDAPSKEDFIVLRREQSSIRPFPVLSLSFSSSLLRRQVTLEYILHPVRHLPSIFPFVPLFLQNWMRLFFPNTFSFFPPVFFCFIVTVVTWPERFQRQGHAVCQSQILL